MKIKFITKLISAACAATMATSAVAMPVGAINEQERGQISDNANLFNNFQGQAYYAGINDPNYLSKIRCNIDLINKYEKELEGCLNMIRQLKIDADYARFRPNRTYNYVLSQGLFKFAKHYGEALEWWDPYSVLDRVAFIDQSSRETIFNIANKLKQQLGSRISDGEYRNLYGALARLEILLINDGIYFADVRANANRALSEYMEAKGAIDLFYDWQAQEVAEQLDKKEKQIAEDKEMAELDGIAWQIEEDEKTKKEFREKLVRYDEDFAKEEQEKENYIASDELLAKQERIAEDEKLAESLGREEQAKADEETKKEQEKKKQIDIDKKLAEQEQHIEDEIEKNDENLSFAVEAQLKEAGDSIANYSSYEEARAVAVATQQSIMEQIKKDQESVKNKK